MKLRTRFLLILLTVVFSGALCTFVLIRTSAENVFRSYVFSGDREKARLYAALLGELYARDRSWDGVQSFLAEFPALVYSFLDRRIHGDGTWVYPFRLPPEASRVLGAERIVVADGNGIIVADTAGDLLGSVHPPHHLVSGVPVLADTVRVGAVLVGSMIDSSLTPTGERFLEALTVSLGTATLVSGLLAFVLGLFFMLRVSRALGSLTSGARRVAGGDFTVRVPVRGRDEIAELSDSFNLMTDELRKLEEAKRRIIADSAHELRTPVTLIRGTLEGILDGVFPADEGTLKSVHEETLRLSRLIDTLRELELIESGKLALRIESVDIGELAEGTTVLFASSLKEKEITLNVSIRSSPAPSLRGDRLRLSEVLYNLVSNAVRHSPEGGRIEIGVAGEEGRVMIEVADSGPGVPAEERERIFERFYRIDKARSSEHGGRGLGLAIAAEIVKAHGGTLSVGTSSLGGASFRIRIPVATPF